MQPPRFLRSALLAMLLVAALAPATHAELTALQRAQLKQTTELIRQAETRNQAGEHEDSRQAIIEAMRHLDAALADADAEVFEIAERQRLVVRIERVHALLQLEGAVLPPFERPEYGTRRRSYLEPAAGEGSPEKANRSEPSPPTALPLAADASTEPAPDTAPDTAPAAAETVTFARHIAPLLVDNCNGCHIDAMQARGGLRMDSFAELMRGGATGPVIEPGNSASSLLIRKLRGEEGNRMPAGGREPLSNEEIAMISQWIDRGAALGEASPEQPLRVMSAQAWAKNATPDELAARRRELARRNWQLGAPAEAQDTVAEAENKAAFVIGNVSPETADRVAKGALAALKKVRTVIPSPPRAKGDATTAALDGPVTIFVFPRRYDYSEFSKMVERREIPPEWDAHWHYDGVDAYASVVVEEDDLKAVEARLIAPLASLSLAPRGELPRWFSEGVGRATAARLAARQLDFPGRWDAALPAAVSQVASPDQLTQGKLPPEQSDLIGYGVGKSLLGRGGRRQFDALLRNLDAGATFDEAFAAAVGATPEQFLTAWFRWYATQRRR